MYTIINMVIKTRRNISGGAKQTKKGGVSLGSMRKKAFDKFNVSACTTPHGALKYIIGRFNTYIKEILNPPPKGVSEDEHNKRISRYIQEFAIFKRKAINLLVLFDPEFVNKIVDPERFGIARYNKDSPDYKIIEKLAVVIDAQVKSDVSMRKLTTLGDNKNIGQYDDDMKKMLNNTETQDKYGIDAKLPSEERAEKLWTKIKDKYIEKFEVSGDKGAKEAAKGIGINIEKPTPSPDSEAVAA